MHQRIAALHDISGFGRGSMTTAIAVFAAQGIQCCPVVGAVLSAHTAFPHVTVHDLTDDLPAYVENWKELKLDFDAVYSGYMSSAAQILQVENLHRSCMRPGGLLVVDPVMGDNGKPYAGAFGEQFAAQMAALCSQADIITPNLTEAAMLLGDAPDGWREDEASVTVLLDRLLKLGCKAAVITGVHDTKGRIGAGWIDSHGRRGFAYCPKVDAYFPGTGDLFASVMLSSLLKDPRRSLASAVEKAVEFVYRCIEETVKEGTDPLEGVLLEKMLPLFLNR
ncbi:pyridoxamine kinase [Acidaminobacterium chupaoyuni]